MTILQIVLFLALAVSGLFLLGALYGHHGD